MRSCWKKTRYRPVETLDSELKEITEKIAKQDDEFGGVAFAVFKRQECVDKVVDYYSFGGPWALIKRIFYVLTHCRKYPWQQNLLYSRLDKVRVKVEQAPEPADIIWENLTLGIWHRVFFRCLTWIVMVIVLVMSFWVNFFIYDWKKSSAQAADGGDAGSQISNRAIGFIGSYLLILTNYIMQ